MQFRHFVSWVLYAFFFYGAIGSPVVPAIAQDTGTYRTIEQIKLDGLQAIPKETVLRKLAALPEIIEALHPSVDEETFRSRVTDAVTRGFLACGFIDSRVTSSQPTTEQFWLTINEGPRFRWGEIHVVSAHESVSDWVREKLAAATTDKKKESKLWRQGKPATGTPIGQFGLINEVRAELSRLGVAATNGKIEFKRNEREKLVDLHVTLDPKDTAFFVPPIAAKDAQDEPTAEVASDSSDTKIGVAAELANIYDKYFAKPQTGFVVRRKQKGMIKRIGFGKDELFCEVLSADQERITSVTLDPDNILIECDPGQPAWRLPNFNVSLVLKQKSISEANGSDPLTLMMNWSNSTNKPRPKLDRGFTFTPDGWQEWFPSNLTKVTEADGQKTYRFGDHKLVVDENNESIHLTGTDSSGNELDIRSAPEDAITKAAAELIPSSNVRDILVRDTDGVECALSEVLVDVFGAGPEDHEFYIQAGNGNKSVWGVLLLSMVRDQRFAKRESLISKFATLYALHLSAHHSHFGDRLDEIEKDALAGPATALVIADLAQLSGDLERAAEYFSRATFLIHNNDAVDRDLDLLFSETNLIGQVSENIDIKEVLQLAINIEKASSGNENWFVSQMIQSMPNAVNADQRRENARLLARIVFDYKYRASLNEFMKTKLAEVKSKQQKIAAKQKAKKEAKKSKKR